ncbi:ptzL [Candidatus Endolissoclinum faulkneri L2]|uniref:Malonyl CoA-acyl carrier protein transacylase n=1 Tax=Candidatus Endolissoclinum faulkneri L2 TaxID=1193729 RepID=K7YQL9_9PROT|nr:ACP S-malonyltransferase [Candidatus Endolissoclinum faulkneri]AFX98844.1 ptzL [Candidatus Endolissoclinum faulkneri L2]
MTKIFVFPGQGSQAKGMGKNLFDRYPDLVAEANDILGYSIKTLCLENPNGDLIRTQFTQPALFIVNALSYLARLEELGEKPAFVTGHSLGEYNALFVAEVFSFADGIRLVQRRGKLMSEVSDGAMIAVIGLNIEAIHDILAENENKEIDVANHNAPKQIVLAGPTEDLKAIALTCEKRSNVRVVSLNVGAAFHSRYMQPIKNAFGAFIAGFSFKAPMLPVIANLTALPYRDDEISHNLVQQIDHTVRWVESIQYLMQETNANFEEIGYGNILSKLINEISMVTLPNKAVGR